MADRMAVTGNKLQLMVQSVNDHHFIFLKLCVQVLNYSLVIRKRKFLFIRKIIEKNIFIVRIGGKYHPNI